MNSLTDQQLLRDYAERRSEAAFAELVQRHVDFVYSAALRVIRDPHLAEDVTQGAFVALAANARQLWDRPVLAGWLHCTARNLATKIVRSEVRRRVREQETVAMNELLSTEADANWEHIAPHLDAALGELSESDRDAVLLRYFERKSARELGPMFGISDEAAQKRVSRAVEQLRQFFAKRGVTIGASGLIALVSVHAVQAAPVGLAATASTAAILAGTTLLATGTATATKAIAMNTLQKSLIGAALVAALGVGIYSCHQDSPTITNFHPVLLDDFYQRQFADYRPTESWAQVPRGETNFNGVPFLMVGKIDLNGLGRARDGEFHPPRVGEVPVGRRAARLHLLHGASYDSPDYTPIACVLLRYENDEPRKLFIRYGVHVRNWYVEANEIDPTLSDPRSLAVWTGNTRPDGSGTPTRLFKSTFDNPLPAQKIRSLELLSLFARANSVILAITLDDSPDAAQPSNPALEDNDDSVLRREDFLRVLDDATGQPVSNVAARLTVTELRRTYRFGDYFSDARGQVPILYPPGRFQKFVVEMTAAGYLPANLEILSDDGLMDPDQPVRLKRESAP